MANTIADTSITPLQMKTLWEMICRGEITAQHLEVFLAYPDRCRMVGPTWPITLPWLPIYEELGLGMQYKEYIEQVSLTPQPFLWAVPVIEGLTILKVLGYLDTLGIRVNRLGDFSAEYLMDVRHPSIGSYVVKFRIAPNSAESSKELYRNSVFKEGMEKGTTLLEELLLVAAYFKKTGLQLDSRETKLCFGSRTTRGNVPELYWKKRQLFIVDVLPADFTTLGLAASVVE